MLLPQTLDFVGEFRPFFFAQFSAHRKSPAHFIVFLAKTRKASDDSRRSAGFRSFSILAAPPREDWRSRAPPAIMSASRVESKAKKATGQESGGVALDRLPVRQGLIVKARLLY
jgi:hypothetical protein